MNSTLVHQFNSMWMASVSTKYRLLFMHAWQRGVELKWFGPEEPVAFTSRYDSWRYLDNIPELPKTLDTLGYNL